LLGEPGLGLYVSGRISLRPNCAGADDFGVHICDQDHGVRSWFKVRGEKMPREPKLYRAIHARVPAQPGSGIGRSGSVPIYGSAELPSTVRVAIADLRLLIYPTVKPRAQACRAAVVQFCLRSERQMRHGRAQALSAGLRQPTRSAPQRSHRGAQAGRWTAQCLCAGNHAVQLLAACVQDYFVVPDFSVRYAILVGIFDNVTSQRLSDSE
jgi:hypothetical protein